MSNHDLHGVVTARSRAGGLKRMKVMREHPGEEQRATFLELFFDLVFVFAVTQLSHHLLGHLTVEGAAQTLLLLLVVWWAWIYTAWMTNWFDPDSVPVRVTLLAGMLASLAMAIAIPHAFGSGALPFAVGYVGLQVVRNAFLVAATKPESPLHVGVRQMLAWSLWTGSIWIAGAFADGEARAALHGRELLVLAAGPALYLAGHLAFRLRMIGTLAPKRIVAIAALAVGVVATSASPSLVSLAVVVAVLTLLAAAETAGRLRSVTPIA